MKGKRARSYPGYGVKVRADVTGFACIGRQGSAGTGRTRKEAMAAYADRHEANDDQFLESHCAVVG